MMILAFEPVHAHADFSVKEWVKQLIHWDAPAPEESALAPAINPAPAPTPSIPDLLRELHSRSAAQRLIALDALTKTQDASPAVITHLVRATQDLHPDVAAQASHALSNLSRLGYSDQVVATFQQELAQRPAPRLVPTGLEFRILNPEEEKRAEAAFGSAR